MSETTGPAPGGDAGGAAPPSISVSQAASLLRRNREGPAAPAPAAPAAPLNGAAPLPAVPLNRAAPLEGLAPPPPAPNAFAEPGDGADPLAALAEALRHPQQPQAAEHGELMPDDGRVTFQLEGGELVTLTAAELKRGVFRERDYTTKMQELAGQRREYDAQAAQLAEILPILIPAMQRQLKGEAEALGPMPSEAEWANLAQYDPQQYHAKRAQFDLALRKQAEIQRIEQMAQQQQQQALRARVAEGHQLLSQRLPGWNDDGQRQRIQSALKDWGIENGFSKEELSAIAEPRYVLAMAKAMMFDRMSAGVGNGQAPAPQITGPRGAAPPPPARGAIRAAEAAFDGNSNVANAARLLSARRHGR